MEPFEKLIFSASHTLLFTFLNKKARQAREMTTLHNYGLDFCYSQNYLCRLVKGAAKREAVVLEKPPRK